MKSQKPYKRTDRVGNQILDILGQVLFKYIDLSHIGFVTFTHVDIAPDFRTAKVFYSILIQKLISKKLTLKLIKDERLLKNL